MTGLLNTYSPESLIVSTSMYVLSVAGPAESQKKWGCKTVRKYEAKSLIGPLDSNRVIGVANAN